MMKIQHKTACILLAGILGLLASPWAMAQAVKVTSANPNELPQGTLGKDITINGSGFSGKVRVFFYQSDNGEPGGITVNSATVVDGNTIVANIDIDDFAIVAKYDIEVKLTGRRGGKGTTLFSVLEKKAYYDCNEVFGLDYPTECDCTFSRNVDGGKGTPSTWIWNMRESCTTHATLRLPSFEALSGEFGDEVLTAQSPFSGSSVVANEGHRAQVFQFNIEIAAGVVAGCGENKLNSAIAFVLDEDSVSPETGDHDGRPYPRTRLRVWGTNIDRQPGAAPLCRAIDFRRDPLYDAKYDPATYDDAVAEVYNVLIAAGTYEQSAIRVAGFTPHDRSGSRVMVGIDSATVMPSAATAALEYGPVHGPGGVQQNVITANGGIGVLVHGSGLDDVAISQNHVSGALTAIRVDYPANEVFFKSNVLTGDDDPGTNDIGICSDAAVNRYQSNRIELFNTDVQEGGCTPP